MDEHSLRNRPRYLLLIIAAGSFLYGCLSPLLRGHSPLQTPAGMIAGSLVNSILCAVWCQLDSAQRGQLPPRGSVALTVALPPLGIPVYLFRTRPWPAALAALGKTFLYVFFLLVLMIVGAAISTLPRSL